MLLFELNTCLLCSFMCRGIILQKNLSWILVCLNMQGWNLQWFRNWLTDEWFRNWLTAEWGTLAVNVGARGAGRTSQRVKSSLELWQISPFYPPLLLWVCSSPPFPMEGLFCVFQPRLLKLNAAPYQWNGNMTPCSVWHWIAALQGSQKP